MSSPVGLSPALAAPFRRGRARLRLQALASAGQPDASVTADGGQVAAAVTYLDVTTAE